MAPKTVLEATAMLSAQVQKKGERVLATVAHMMRVLGGNIRDEESGLSAKATCLQWQNAQLFFSRPQGH